MIIVHFLMSSTNKW